MWLLFLGLHLVGLVGYSLLLRKAVKGHVNQLTLAALMQTATALPMVVALFIWPPDISEYGLPALLLILVATILVVIIQLANVKALSHLDASTFSILFNLRIVFATFLGVILLDEHILPLQIIGGLFIFAAVFTLHHKDGKHLPLAGAFWGVVAALAISVLNTSEKELINSVGYLHYATPVMILACASLWGMMIASGQNLSFALVRQPRMLWLMGLRALSTHGIILAFSAGAMISIANYISSLSVVVIVVLGIVLLHERQYLRQKIVATILAVAGLTAILVAGVV